MAKPLVFNVNGVECAFDIAKLDRKKLYGWKSVVAFDSNGNECLKMDLDQTGSFIIPPGGKGLGIIDLQGNWVDKSQLIALLDDGSPAQLVPSSFETPVELKQTVTIEEFLDYNIDYVYVMDPVGSSQELLDLVKKTDGIYCFEFNYRTDYEGSTAFLVESKDKLYLLVGSKNEFEFIGLAEAAEINLEEESEGFDEDDLDFNMM